MLRSIDTNRPVLFLRRHDVSRRPLRVVLERADNRSGRRIKLTVRAAGRGTVPFCSQITSSYSNECPSITFTGITGRALNAIVVDPAVRFTRVLVGLTCNGPGCPRRYQERRPHTNGKPLRFTGYRDLRQGAMLRVSVRARGYDGSSRTVRVTRGGLVVSAYQCLANGTMTAVVACR